MKTVVLVGCGKEKLARRAAAKDLYTGLLFRKARAYAEKFGDEWGILSARHGLLLPDQKIDPYDLALGDLPREELEAWIWLTNEQLRGRWLRRKRTEAGLVRRTGAFVCLAGELYARAFEKPVRLEVELPMAGLSLGRRLQYLNGALSRET